MKKTAILITVLVTTATTLFACTSEPIQTQTQENQTQEELSQEDFNNSGRAKAIENESDLWPVFNEEEIGFSFKYPQDITLASSGEFIKASDKTILKVESQNIGEGDRPWDFSLEESQKNIESLSAGNFGQNFDNPLASSQKVKSVGSLFAQDFLVLTRFEVCNVTLERKLLFFFNNKEIVVTLYGPITKLKEQMPEFFVYDKENCGEEFVWNTEKQDEFFETLLNKKASAEIQKWFEDFDIIAETIIFAHK